MIYITYKGTNPSLIHLATTVTALEAALEGTWGTESMVRNRGYGVEERDFFQRFEQAAPAKRLNLIKWQDRKRIDYAIISLRFQWMVDQVASAIAPATQAAEAVHAEIQQTEHHWNSDFNSSVAMNNYVYTRALVSAATELVNRYRENFAKDELLVTCLEALRDNYKKLPEITLSHVIGVNLRNDDKVPSPGAFLSTCHIAPLTVDHPSFGAMTDLLAQSREQHLETGELLHALVTEVKGTLNEQNYKTQLSQAVSEPFRFDDLRRAQQVHRSNYESVRTACSYGNARLHELLNKLCAACKVVREQPLPESELDRDRLFAACMLVYWEVIVLFRFHEDKGHAIWEDPTNGEGDLNKLFPLVMADSEELAKTNIRNRRCWYSDSWKRGWALAFLQNFGTEKLTPVASSSPESGEKRQ